MDISVDSDRLPRQRSLPVQWKRIYRLTVVLPRARYLSGLHATAVKSKLGESFTLAEKMLLRMRTLLEMQVRNCRSGLAREEGILAITTPRYACAYRTCSVSLLSLELSEPEERKYEGWRDTLSRIDSVASNLSTDWPNSWRRTRSISAIRVIVALNEHEGQRCRADGGIGVL